MTIYLVYAWWGYDADYFLGAFTTKEKAEERVAADKEQYSAERDRFQRIDVVVLDEAVAG